ncbi:MAG: hypothetical protein IJ253_01110 [Bacteroidaceae bacterium]|nr:hypothetical protein [Bacteroidaceae bacterium]
MNKNIIIALACIALLCGCQEREKTIYKVPLSEHMAELRQQERAYMDSLEKYSALLDTAQVRYYFDLHEAASAAHSAAMRQEVDAFMAEKDNEAENADNDITTTQMIVLYVLAVVTLALLIYLSIISKFWTRLGWLFEDVWHWFKETASISPGPCFGKEDLTDEEIHEIMNIIHHGNPPKYKIVRGEGMNKEDKKQG